MWFYACSDYWNLCVERLKCHMSMCNYGLVVRMIVFDVLGVRSYMFVLCSSLIKEFEV